MTSVRRRTAAVLLAALAVGSSGAALVGATAQAAPSSAHGTSWTGTKKLTRVFTQADGSTFTFPSHQVTVHVDRTRNLRSRERVQDHLAGSTTECRARGQPVRRERAAAGVPGRHPRVPRPRRPAAAEGQTALARHLLDRLGGRTLPGDPGRQRRGVDPRSVRHRRGQGAAVRDDAVPEHQRLPDREHPGLLHPPHAVPQHQGQGVPGVRRRPHAARGGCGLGVPTQRDRRLHRPQGPWLGPVRGPYRGRERVARLLAHGRVLDRGDPDQRAQL